MAYPPQPQRRPGATAPAVRPPQPPSIIQGGARPRAPIAYDPGYAALGGPAPIIVQAKPSWSRPGSVTAAAVLAFIIAGLNLVAAMGYLFTSNAAGKFGADEFQAETLAYGLINLFAALALVAGAAGLLGRQEWGRWALCLGAGMDALYSLWRVIQGFVDDDSFGNPMGLLFIVMDVLIIVCALLPTTSAYLATRNPVHQSLGMRR
jgi:hypothetical protein